MNQIKTHKSEINDQNDHDFPFYPGFKSMLLFTESCNPNLKMTHLRCHHDNPQFNGHLQNILFGNFWNLLTF